MSSSVLDFHALVQALEEHPEWRAELRRLILSEEFLSLPATVRRLEEDLARLTATVERLAENQAEMQAILRDLVAAQARTEKRVEELAQAQARTEKRVEELVQAQARTEKRVEELAQAQARTEKRVEELAQAQARTEKRVEELAQAQARTEKRVEELVQAQARTEKRVEELAQAQARTEKRVEELVQAQARTEKRVEELAQAQVRTEKRVEELAQAQTHTEQALQQLTQRVEKMALQLGEVRGQVLEIRFQEKAPAFFGRFLRKVRVLPSVQVAELLDEAVDAGRISWEERQAVLLADAVVQGLASDGSPMSVVVEVSSVVDERDVTRAVERAEILTKALEARVQAAVAGHEVPPPIRNLANRLGVWCLEDGRQVAAAG